MTRFFKNRQTFFAFFDSCNQLHPEVTAITVFCGAFDYDSVFLTSSRPRPFFLPPTVCFDHRTPQEKHRAVVFSGAFDYDTAFDCCASLEGLFLLCRLALVTAPPGGGSTTESSQHSLQLWHGFQGFPAPPLFSAKRPTASPCACWREAPGASWCGRD